MKKLIWVVVVVVVAAGAYFWLQPSVPEESGPIKIGFIGPLSGDGASIGTVNKAAVEIAAREINEAGGVGGRPFQVIYEDGQCNAKSAVDAANKLINADGVKVIIGGLCSTETSAFGPIAMQNGVVVLSYGSSAPSLSKLGKYFFRSYPSDAFQGKFGAEYAYNKLGARSVAVAYNISEWGNGIKDVFRQRFEELGGKVVVEEGVPQDGRDWRTPLAKIKSANPDLIYTPIYPESNVVFVRQARELDIKTPILGADASEDPKFISNVPSGLSVSFTVPVTPAPEGFKRKIQAVTGSDQVPIGTPNAYDNVYIIVQAIEKVGLDADKIADHLHGLRNYQGVSGAIGFDANGDLLRSDYIVKIVRNGTAEELK